MVSPSGHGRSRVDENLSKLGRSRKVAITTPHFCTPFPLVAKTEFIATVPRRLALQSELRLQAFELPFETPTFKLHVLWGPLSHNDSAHKWLRDQVTQIAQASSTEETQDDLQAQ